MATPHLQGQKGDYANIVLVPGDPLRAEFIAQNLPELTGFVNSESGSFL